MLRNILLRARQSSVNALLANRCRAFSATGPDGKGNEADGKQQSPPKEVLNHADIQIIDYDDPDYLPLPQYPFKPNEPLSVRKQRLIYQSRKRGMLENDLLLSTFVDKYLKDMNAELTEQYDKLINGVSNDWDIYYWATIAKPTPPEYDNEVMRMLKQHVSNIEREQRLRQPNLCN